MLDRGSHSTSIQKLSLQHTFLDFENCWWRLSDSVLVGGRADVSSGMVHLGLWDLEGISSLVDSVWKWSSQLISVPSDLAVWDSWNPATESSWFTLIDDEMWRVDDGLWGTSA